ncbi:unnamed protein product [Caenorhabditis sp. 36 PRJEB53466]|nr:unnamed protein product [Caenorhabditis sp. 36 PRJEB53466]
MFVLFFSFSFSSVSHRANGAAADGITEEVTVVPAVIMEEETVDTVDSMEEVMNIVDFYENVSAIAGGFGGQQAWNVQNAARIGTEVAEGVLVAEEVSEAIGK